MKHIIFAAAMALLPLIANGQKDGNTEKEAPTRGVMADVMGPNIVGVSFDSRLKAGNRGWGYRVGIGFNKENDDLYSMYCTSTENTALSTWSESRTRGFGIPLEVNYLAGKKRSKFEASLGASLGYFRQRMDTHTDLVTTDHTWDYEGDDAIITGQSESEREYRGHFGYLIYSNVGYRLQKPKGFLFRAGVTIGWGGGSHTPYHALWSLSPYISFGYSF